LGGAALASLLLAGGCGRNLFDNGFLATDEAVPNPERLPDLPVRIVDSIGEVDEPNHDFATADEVRAADLQVNYVDQTIGRNDLIQIVVQDQVNGGGQDTMRNGRVSDTGMLNIPGSMEPVKAAGLTESELQKVVAQKYREGGVLPNANVTVTIAESRQRTFSILGAVSGPGQYMINEANFRLLDALVVARDVTNAPENIYVIRRTASERAATRPAAPEVRPERPVDPLAPQPRGQRPDPVRPVLADLRADAAGGGGTAAPAPAEGEGKFITIDGKTRVIGGGGGNAAGGPATAPDVPAARIGAPAGGVEPAPQAAAPKAPGEFQFGADLPEPEARIIRVPYSLLRGGDLRYNVVIRPQDLIMVPQPHTGEYYVGGHVNRTGVYSLTGRQITLKQAIVSAGMLDQLGVPERAYVVRRIRRGGKPEEVYYRVNLAEVFSGQQPDLFLKPDDQLFVGTAFWAGFANAIRGAFRFSYGGGFLYDRNFAPQQDQTR